MTASMTKHELPRPTDAELAILRVLWERGASTVRQVHDVLSRERPTAYTTALKLLDRAFAGSASKLVMQALAAKRASAEELGEIRRLLQSEEGGRDADKDPRREDREDSHDRD
jgi:predicted transcriptional regulator